MCRLEICYKISLLSIFAVFSELKLTSYFRQSFTDKNRNQTYIYKIVCVLCLCVFVFKLNFKIDRELFQIDKIPHF